MAKLKLDAIEILPYLENIREWKLKVPIYWDTLNAQDIADCYNGVGSDLTAKPLRKALSYIYDFALESVIIHDVIWTHLEGQGIDIEYFYESNKDLKKNARICLNKKYSWYHPYYSWSYPKTWLAQFFCDKFGEEAWIS